MKEDILYAKVGSREWEKVDGRHCIRDGKAVLV